MLRTLILIGLGGGVGSVLRYLTTVLTQKYFQATFPLATFTVNVSGCLLIGCLSLLQSGNMRMSILYTLSSVLAGILAAWGGMQLTK